MIGRRPVVPQIYFIRYDKKNGKRKEKKVKRKLKKKKIIFPV